MTAPHERHLLVFSTRTWLAAYHRVKGDSTAVRHGLTGVRLVHSSETFRINERNDREGLRPRSSSLLPSRALPRERIPDSG